MFTMLGGEQSIGDIMAEKIECQIRTMQVFSSLVSIGRRLRFVSRKPASIAERIKLIKVAKAKCVELLLLLPEEPIVIEIMTKEPSLTPPALPMCALACGRTSKPPEDMLSDVQGTRFVAWSKLQYAACEASVCGTCRSMDVNTACTASSICAGSA